MKKLNTIWLKYKTWGNSSLVGSCIVSTVNIAFVMALFLLFFYALGIFNPFSDKELSQDSPISDSSETNEDCNITGINLHGTLLTYIPNHSENDSFFNYDTTSSESIVWAIREANKNEKIRAIVIETDSGGGSPVGGEEISNAIKHSDKPVMAFVREIGASSAYWAISGADKIFASRNSNVGGIGITSSYLTNVTKNTKDGYTYEQLSAGKYKDAGSANKTLTKEEKELFMRDINIVYENFIEAISKNRNIPIEKVRIFADGATVLGDKALSLGMIDEIGGIYEVEKYLEEVTGEESEICWQ